MARKGDFSTRTNKFADFSRQTAAQLATPLSQWVINPDLLTDAERSDWWNLFQACQGSYLPFSFIDPGDNLLQFSEAQNSAPWGLSNAGASNTSAVADPFGIVSGRVTALTISSTAGILLQQQPIIPAGTGNSRTKGLTVVVSCWLRTNSVTSSCKLFVGDDASTEGSSVLCNLTSSWQRFSVSHQFSPNNVRSLTEFVLNTFNAAGSIYMFGAQMELGAVASGYKQTTQYCGVHPTCYFQTDEFDGTQSEFNINSLQLVIEESA